MKDEEMAEEYVNNKGFGTDYNNIESSEPLGIDQEKLYDKSPLDNLYKTAIELVKENAKLKVEKQQMQEQIKKILLDENAEIGDIRKLVGMDWYNVKEIEQLKAKLDEYVNIAEDDEFKCDKLQKKIKELEEKIEEMKVELHHRLVSPSSSDSERLNKIVDLDRLWKFGEEF